MLVYPAGVSTSGSGYTIENSLWFDGSADYLTKTFGSTGTSQTVYTVSFWARPSTISPTGGNNYVIAVGPSGSGGGEDLRYVGGGLGSLYIQATDGTEALNTGDAARFRDLTAWHHVIFSRNTANSNGDKSKLYVNGTRITAFDSSYGTRGQDLTANGAFGSTHPYFIGRESYGTSVHYNGYLAEFAVIDGTEYAPSDFGEYDTNGVWRPIDLSGLTYGDNGFLLQFKQTGSTQDAYGIGADTSGKSNHFAVGGGSIQTNQVIDSPTDDASNNIGNYATINPNDTNPSGAVPVISNGNITFTRTATGSSDNQQAYATQIAIGKKYFEFDMTSNNNSMEVGWAAPGEITGNEGAGISSFDVEVYLLSMNAAGGGGPWPLTIHKGQAGGGGGTSTNTSLDSSEITTTPRLKFAIDVDAKKYWFGVVDSSYGGWLNSSGIHGQSFSEAAPTGTWTSDSRFIPYIFGHAQLAAGTIYFRDDDWTDTAPSGFTALNTANLPAPTVTDPSAYFGGILWSGDNASTRNITGLTDASGTAWTPDFAWIKGRNVDARNRIYDVVRGTASGKNLNTDQTDAEGSENTNGYVSDFIAGGVELTRQTNAYYYNDTGKNYVGFFMKAGGSPSTIAADSVSSGIPSLASSVSAADHGGFSVGTFTAVSGTMKVGHGLSRTPVMIWTKNTGSTGQWWIYHEGMGNSHYTVLNHTDVATSSSDVWAATTPDTNTFSTNSTWLGTGDVYHFCAFARTPGFIGAGTFEGGNGVNVVINDGGSGFRPAFLIIKSIDATRYWVLHDSTRNTYNPASIRTHPNTSESEAVSGTADIDFLANGFKLRNTSSHSGGSAETFIYLAFAEQPFGGDGVAQARAR